MGSYYQNKIYFRFSNKVFTYTHFNFSFVIANVVDNFYNIYEIILPFIFW